MLKEISVLFFSFLKHFYKELILMKKTFFLFTLILVFAFTVSLSANVGIGFEFGSNFVMDTDGEDGSSRVFILTFDLSEDLSVGYYREEADGDDILKTSINAIQVKHKITDMLSAGIRFGNAEDFNNDNTVYTGIFGSVSLLSRTSETFSGSINLNVGYDFLPAFDEDFIKFGLSSAIKF